MVGGLVALHLILAIAGEAIYVPDRTWLIARIVEDDRMPIALQRQLAKPGRPAMPLTNNKNKRPFWTMHN